MRHSLFPLLLAALPLLSQDSSEYFEKKVRPLLAKSCAGCHNAKLKSAGLDLSTPEGIAAGGMSGALYAKSKPEESLLLKVLSYDERLKMPPSGKLPQQDIKDLATWIQGGAPLPGGLAPGAGAPGGSMQTRKHGRGISDAEKKFWAFQPVSDPQKPAVKDIAWVQSPIDNFILAKLEAKGLSPTPPAARAALLRRVTFGLTGLAPSPVEVRDFLADASPNALEKVIDRLLASPRYGEHWGRHWLDVARYADSTGNDEDHRYPYAFRYRDYVIDSFNQDVPYDRFIQEQIAGDLLPPPPGEKVNRRGIIATGFLALGAKAVAQQDKKRMLVDVYDEQIDVVSKGVLGLTMACARCHDHKFDPILTKDYYSWNTIFAATRNFKQPDQHVASLLYTPLAPEEEYNRFIQGRELSDKKRGEMLDLIENQTAAHTLELGARMAEYMLAARAAMAGKPNANAALRKPVLDKWIAFLEQSKTKRSYMKDWLTATDAAAPQIAAAYQKRYLAKQAEWVKGMERTRKMRRNRNLSMPPKLGSDDDVFFVDVHYDGPLSVKEPEREALWPAGKTAPINALAAEVKSILAAMPPEPDMACAVAEGSEGVTAGKVYVRGDYGTLGEDAPKGVPTVLAAAAPAPDFAAGKASGRLELAQWLTRADNPMTARVLVNRMWYWHFGEGIVRTPDNFGRMGEKPTHPELLDYLASQMMRNGWSIKKMQKTLLLSSAYQMASFTNDATVAADPENALFSRFPRRRLSVEELHDSMLEIDGAIDLTMGGTLQSGFGTDGENSDSRLSMKPDAIKRRTVYLPLRRANLPGLLNLFDFGDATSSASKRASTTIAPQALFLMNSDFVAERARNLAAQTAAAGNPGDRLKSLYLRILGREATPGEIDNGLSYLSQFQQKFAPGRADSDAWLSLSRILFSSNEFIYLD